MQLPLLQLLDILNLCPAVSGGNSYDNISCYKNNFPHQNLIFLSEMLWDFYPLTCRNCQQFYIFCFPTSLHSFGFPLQAPFNLSHNSFKALMNFHHFKFIFLAWLSISFIQLSSLVLLLKEWYLVPQILSEAIWTLFPLLPESFFAFFCVPVPQHYSEEYSNFRGLCGVYFTSDCHEIIGWWCHYQSFELTFKTH